MPVTKEDKTLIKNLFTLEYNSAKRVSCQRLYVGSIYSVSRKSNHPKTIDNIFAYAKPFSAKFCPVIGNLYPLMCTEFGKFML